MRFWKLKWKKNYGLGNTSGETSNTNTPKTSSVSVAMKDIEATVIKQVKKQKKKTQTNFW